MNGYHFFFKIVKLTNLTLMTGLWASHLMAQPRPITEASLLDNKPTAKNQTDGIDYNYLVEITSGFAVGNIRVDGLDGHNAIPINLTLGIPVDDVSLDDFAGGVFRGNTDFLFKSTNFILDGTQEDRLFGFSFGPRYNFIQPNWPIIPFAEGLVGFGFVNSDPRIDPSGEQFGSGQDFNFLFSVAIGFRYDITDQAFLRLAAVYTHVSNADLSLPEFENKALDMIGPELSLGWKF